MANNYKIAGLEIKRKRKLCELQKELKALLRYHNIACKDVADNLNWSLTKMSYLINGHRAIRKSDIVLLVEFDWPSDITKLLQKMFGCYK